MRKLSKNPYLNSIYAELSIILVVGIMQRVGKPNTPDAFFAPIAALSLVVLVVAVMGYFFFGEPFLLYLGGAKKQAVTFFMRTVLGFAAITALVLLIVSIPPR